MSTNKLYEISSQGGEFKDRSKSVFDTLVGLEKQHQNKRKTYEDEIMQVEENEKNNDVLEFKKPMMRKPKQPGHVANPDKYTKYSLENVNEGQMNANLNRQAAMEFLTERKTAASEVPSKTFQPEFNKGLNKMDKQQLTEIEEENDHGVERVVINADKDSEIIFRRKGFNGKPNIRQKAAEAAEEENLAHASAKSEGKDEVDRASTQSELDSEESFDTNESSESGSFTDMRMAFRSPKPRKNYSELPESEELNDSDYDPSEDEEQENNDDDEGEDENGNAEDELAVKEKANETNQPDESDTESL